MNRAFVLIWGVAFVWWVWLFSQPYQSWIPFGCATLGLLAENYLVNVKARATGRFEEQKPFFVFVERYIPFKYVAPLALGIATLALAYYASTVMKLNFGLATIPLVWAPTFALALLCSANDAYQLWIQVKNS